MTNDDKKIKYPEKINDLIAFLITMGAPLKHPDYIVSKYEKYLGSERTDEHLWGLNHDGILQMLRYLEQYNLPHLALKNHMREELDTIKKLRNKFNER